MVSKSNEHENAPEKRAGTEQAWKRVRNLTGPERCQRDERNRNGHERLPKSQIRGISKKLEHQLLEIARERAGKRTCRKIFLKKPNKANVQRNEQPLREVTGERAGNKTYRRTLTGKCSEI